MATANVKTPRLTPRGVRKKDMKKLSAYTIKKRSEIG